MSTLRNSININSGVTKGWRADAIIDNQSRGLPSPSRGVDHTSRGVMIRTRRGGNFGDKPKRWAFGVTIAGKVFTIQPGHVCVWNEAITWLHGTETTDPTTYTYEGATEYCFLCCQIPINGNTPTFIGLSAYPTIDSANVYIPLVRAVSNDSGVNYSLDGNGSILHRGDIHLTGPLLWGT